MSIAILQPLVPLYRNDFFLLLSNKCDLEVFAYRDDNLIKTYFFQKASFKTVHIKNFNIYKLLFIDIFPFFLKKYNIIILPVEKKLITNWLILLFGRFLGKKVVLWGHGLDTRFYEQYSDNMPLLWRLSYLLADGAWFYTEKEKIIWDKIIPNIKSVALNNTIKINLISSEDDDINKKYFIKKYRITTKINFIFCARFSSLHRRPDLLIDFISKVSSISIGLIIIGDGPFKPDFSKFSNIYDFGSVYDDSIKSELFSIADAYFQPAWIGLSVVEAMAYGKAILTLRRSKLNKQGVEYGYIEDKSNGLIFENIDELVGFVSSAKDSDYKVLGSRAQEYYRQNLSMENMVENAIRGLEMVRCES